MKRDKDAIYDPDVDYASLEQHKYADSGDHIFYTCPRCGGKYLATFMTTKDGETMCIDCASEYSD